MAISTRQGDFVESYHKPLTPELERLRLENENAGIPLILKETEDMLSMLLSLKKPGHILEIGTAQGYSALFFASRCPDACVVTIEKEDSMAEAAGLNFNNSPCADRIELLQGDAEEVLSNHIFKNKFDFVFIDAGKTHYREYFSLAEKLCNPGAIIVCDNILISGWIYDRTLPGAKRHRTNVKYMKSFLEYINNREDLTVALSSSGDGLAIIKLDD